MLGCFPVSIELKFQHMMSNTASKVVSTMSEFFSTVSTNRFAAVPPWPRREFQLMTNKESEWEKEPASPWKPIGIVLAHDALVKDGWLFKKAEPRIDSQNCSGAPFGPDSNLAKFCFLLAK